MKKLIDLILFLPWMVVGFFVAILSIFSPKVEDENRKEI